MRDCDIALYGLGVMGSSLAKNMINQGFRVALYGISEKERSTFLFEGKNEKYLICNNEQEMLDSLKHPKKVFLMITAGNPVDSVIERLMPYLSEGDIIMDGGNSHYKDTSRRYKKLSDQGIRFLGIGVSGGEKGALYGPSIMVGGDFTAWSDCKNILQSIAAKEEGRSGCAYIASQGAGHYVKMVHNGIEYAILQLLAETYHVMRYALQLEHEEILYIFKNWKNSSLQSYLIDISISVLDRREEDGLPLIEKILDVAEQNGTGRWTIEDAIERGVYIPTICEAVFARIQSANKALRREGAARLPVHAKKVILKDYEKKLQDSLLFGMIASYAQGFELIGKASVDNNWNIDMPQLTLLWKNGCIIRSTLLNQVKQSLIEEKINILFSDEFSYIQGLEKSLREVTGKVLEIGIAIPGFTSVLVYYNSLRMEQMPINFIQALRDCFGSHSYKRIDKEGRFHTEW